MPQFFTIDVKGYNFKTSGGYAKFTGLKTYNKELKTMLAIGGNFIVITAECCWVTTLKITSGAFFYIFLITGWNEGSTRFSPLVASSDRRSQLIKNSIKFLRQNKFDGLDLDWGKKIQRCIIIARSFFNAFAIFQNIPLSVTVERQKIVKIMPSLYRNFAKNSNENTTKPDVRDYYWQWLFQLVSNISRKVTTCQN